MSPEEDSTQTSLSRRCRHPPVHLRGGKRQGRRAARPASEDDNPLGLRQPPGRPPQSGSSVFGWSRGRNGVAAVRGQLTRSLHQLHYALTRSGALRASVGSTDASNGVLARVGGLIDRNVECGLDVIMPQAKILLRRRNPRIADDHPPPASPWSKETRRSVFFEMKSLSKRRCKENPGLIKRPRGRAPPLAPQVD